LPVLAFIALCTLRPSAAPAQDVITLAAEDEETALAALDGLLSPIETLQADVLQLIVESDGGVLEESSILMLLKKPDGFYWETLEPFPELIVTDGSTLWNYQPDLEQVVIEPWQNDNSELAAQLLSGDTSGLSADYRLERYHEPGFERFTLLPLDPDSPYRQIRLEFSRGQLGTIHIDSLSGEQTVWQFNDLQMNQPIADERFVFQPPAGVEIVKNPYVQ
jgi:outer membrane lipoprotein carrier protein